MALKKCQIIKSDTYIFINGGDEGSQTPVQELPHIQTSTVYLAV